MSSRTLVLEMDVLPAGGSAGGPIDFAGRLIAAFTAHTPFRPAEWRSAAAPGFFVAATAGDGGRVWTLEPGPQAIWSSGQPIAPSALATFVAGVMRAPGPGAQASGLLREVRAGRGAVTLELTRPHSCLPALLSADRFASLAGRMQERAGMFEPAGRLDGRCIGLRRTASGERLWPAGPETIMLALTDSPAQGVRMFEAGVLDATCNPNLPFAVLDRYAGTPALRQRDLLLAGVLLYGSQALRAPEATSFRRQVAAAIDRERLCAAVGHGLTPLRCVTGLWGGGPKAAGVRGSGHERLPTGLKKLVLAYAAFEPNDAVAAAIATSIQEALGVGVELRPMAYDDYLACLAKPNADLIYSLIQPPYNDPTGMLNGVAGWLGERRPEFRAAVAAAEQIFDPDERLAACGAATQILDEQSPFAAVVRMESRCLVSSQAAELPLGPDGLFRPPALSMAA